MSKYAALLGAITIDTGNLAIRFKEDVTTSTVNLVAGTYFLRGDGSAADFCLALKTALETHAGANTYTVALACSVDPSAVAGTVTITRATGSNTFQILWADALTTFDESLIGFANSNTADDATAKTSTMSPAALWVSPDVPVFYEPEFEYDVTVNRARSGKVRALRQGGPYDRRRVRFDFLDSRRVLEPDNTSDVDATFSQFLERNGDGKRFEFHVTTVSGFVLGALSSSTLIGTAWHFDEETSATFAPERLQPGLSLYGFDLGLLGYVT